MNSISKNVYIDKLDDTVNECNNTYHSTIKIKPANAKWSSYIDFGVENNGKDPEFEEPFEVYNHVKTFKSKNIFTKGYTSASSEEVFMIKNVKNTISWAM